MKLKWLPAFRNKFCYETVLYYETGLLSDISITIVL